MSIYIATDLHGNYNHWQKIKDFLKEDDKLYYLGDAVDRGWHGWDVFKELVDDSRVTFIKGNHEDMMYNSYRTTGPAAIEWFKTWRKNGGGLTEFNMQERDMSQETLDYYLDIIAIMPTYEAVKIEDRTYILSHAGFTPDDAFCLLSDDERDWKLIWDRKHIFTEWPDNMSKVYIVHGHTPHQLLASASIFIDDITAEIPFTYCDGHKIDLDMGTTNSNTSLLYNLTEEKVEFMIQGEDNE
jgi:serine/threonine protein phosphatase 1